MDTISIEGTPKTPTINFDMNKGALEIKGRSIPENSIEFYKPLVDWLEKYAAKPQPQTLVNIQLEYFNTSSSKCLLELMKRLVAVQTSGKKIAFEWLHEPEDDDMKEAGADFRDLLKAPFEIIAK